MSTGWLIGSAVIAVVVAPLIGGLLRGIDRKLTAHMQGRIGPPIIQPFYDVIKLLGKKPMVAGGPQMVFAYAFFVLIVTAVVFFALRQDLLVVLFILFFGSLCLPIGALSVKSPYSQLGGHRELMQFLAYEPILLLAAIPIAIKSGGFPIANIFESGQPLLPKAQELLHDRKIHRPTLFPRQLAPVRHRPLRTGWSNPESVLPAIR